ncbi:MAG TPA: response regulator transcription factor [Sedimentisphaerales bacterium]|jgi:DNA-binding NarL/FixJ family response regulator|nr:response regulator transcription factor [Sedimentisphaerales bacterium]HNU27932.1 response regulator transcription factor [Sedimentisphaerales bacterium]
MSIRIVLADDHAIVRQGLGQGLQREEGMEIVGEASDGRSTVEMTKERRPDVVIMDICMPDLNGIEATREIQRDVPGVRVVALSMHSAKRYVTEMFRAGASGYVLKDCDFAELAQAIRAVVQGRTYISPAISDATESDLSQMTGQVEPTAFSTLTQREREVLQLLSEGKTTKQIALRLHISPKTVEAHRLRVMNKLQIDNVAQLTKYAIREGLTSEET